jgi:hypothetical protein
LSPLEERAKQLYYNPSALLWTDWNMSQESDDVWNRLSDILGTRWTRDQVEQVFGNADPKQRAEAISVPLAFIIQPEFQEALKGMFGSKYGIDAPDYVKKTEIIEGWDMPREQFMQFARGASVAIPVQQMQQQQMQRQR